MSLHGKFRHPIYYPAWQCSLKDLTLLTTTKASSSSNAINTCVNGILQSAFLSHVGGSPLPIIENSSAAFLTLSLVEIDFFRAVVKIKPRLIPSQMKSTFFLFPEPAIERTIKTVRRVETFISRRRTSQTKRGK